MTKIRPNINRKVLLKGARWVILTKKFYLKPNKEQKIILGSMCKSSAKLWNTANYEKKNYKELNLDRFPDWFEQKKRLKTNFCYKNLPSQTVQNTLKVLQKSWDSFLKLLKTSGVENPHPPKFKSKSSKYNIQFLNNGFKILGYTVRFSISKQQKEYLNVQYGIKSKYLYVEIKGFSQLNLNVKEIEFKPLRSGDYKIFMAYEIEDAELKKDNEKYLSIDIGVSNILTCYDSYRQKSFILSGGQYLAVNRYFDKKIAYYQSVYYAQQKAKNPDIKRYKAGIRSSPFQWRCSSPI